MNKQYDMDEMDFIKKIQKNWDKCKTHYNEQFKQIIDDFEYYAGKKMPYDIEQKRNNYDRPNFGSPKLKKYVKMTVNQQTRSLPSIGVISLGNDDLSKKSIFYEAIIKNIEYKSNANVVYKKGYEDASVCGLGYYRVCAKYLSDESFDQELQIEHVINPIYVMIDPLSEKFDLSDANYVFIYTKMDKDEYKIKYPDATVTSLSSIGIDLAFDENEMFLAEYFYAVYEEEQHYQLSNGKSISKKLYEKNQMTIPIVNKKKVKKKKIKWCLTNGTEILEENDWPGKYFPIAPVYGDRHFSTNGKIMYQGLITIAKENQIMYNIILSNLMEVIAQAPRAPWVGIAGQFKGREKEWNAVNNEPMGYIEYNAIDIAGDKIAGPPIRTQYSADLSMLFNGLQNADKDFSDIIGMNDPSFGKDNTPEQSGISTLLKQHQGELINSNMTDNVINSVKHLGDIIFDLIPKVYDTARDITMFNENPKNNKKMRINDPMGEYGEDSLIHPDDTVGIQVAVSPYGETQKQFMLKTLLSLGASNPAIIPMMMDLIFEQLQIPKKDEMVLRARKMLPPELQENSEDPMSGLSPQVKELIAQKEQEYQTQIQMFTQKSQEQINMLTTLASKLNTTQIDLKLNTNKLAIEKYKIDNETQLKLIEIVSRGEQKNRSQIMDGYIKTMLQKIKVDTSVKDVIGPQGNTGDPYVLPGINDPITTDQNREDIETPVEDNEDFNSMFEKELSAKGLNRNLVNDSRQLFKRQGEEDVNNLNKDNNE